MRASFTPACAVLFSLLAALSSSGMDIALTRTTGQYPVESTPVVAEQDGQSYLFAVNRSGQILRWNVDGTNAGPGQDGTLMQLPEGGWFSSLAITQGPDGLQLVACSGEGLVVAVDGQFQMQWQHQLPGETAYGAAVPLVVRDGDTETPGYCLGDRSGTVTCLNIDGSVRWEKQLGLGECRTPMAALDDRHVLVAVGSHLCALDETGQVVWDRDLGKVVQAGPVRCDLPDQDVIACGAGSLFGLNAAGEILWEVPLDEEMDSTIVAATNGSGGDLLFLCKGLWGNLYAFSANGKHLWTHRFRVKSRSKPVVMSDRADMTILTTTYGQEALLFDAAGDLLDLRRLAGAANGAPLLLPKKEGNPRRAVAMTASLLAHFLEMGPLKSPYAVASSPRDVKVSWRPASSAEKSDSLIVENPAGALLRVNVSMPATDGARIVTGTVSARSAFELAFDTPPGAADAPVRAVVQDDSGNILVDETWTSSDANRPQPVSSEPNRIYAWVVPAYATSDPSASLPPTEDATVAVNNLYINEIDQGAFVLMSTYPDPIDVRVTAGGLASDGKHSFDGSVRLYEMVLTGAFNGEDVADALVSLGDADLLTINPGRATKVWVQVDGHGAEPGHYSGVIEVQHILEQVASVELTLSVDVPDLRLDTPFPLTLCTWDYVPNQWFPTRTPEVLDDMTRHGVTVFPRSIGIPRATVNDSGALQCDWSAMDAPLVELKGRGQVLFQMTAPPISFASPPNPEVKRDVEIRYLQQWRDHLRASGWTYADYALYPVDEPGLGHGKRIQSFLDAAQLFRAADPRFRVYTDPVPGLSLADFDRISPYVDVWCPNMRLVSGLLADDPRIQRIMNSGKEVWSYECVAQVRSLSPLRYNRANAWRAHHFGLSGIGFWTHCTTQTDPWLRAKDFNEYELVYPGKLPVPSVRWEAVRDGLEDVAAATLLQAAIATNEAVSTKTDLVQEAKEELRIADNDIMELSDDAFKESRDYLRIGDRRIWHTPTDVTLYAHHRARIAELTLALTAP